MPQSADDPRLRCSDHLGVVPGAMTGSAGGQWRCALASRRVGGGHGTWRHDGWAEHNASGEMCFKIGANVASQRKRCMAPKFSTIFDAEVRTLNLLLSSSPDPAVPAAGLARRQGGARVYSIARRRWPRNVDADWCPSASQLVVAAGGGHLLWPIVIPSITCFL